MEKYTVFVDWKSQFSFLEQNVRAIALSFIKVYYKAAVIKTAYQSKRDKTMEEKNLRN